MPRERAAPAAVDSLGKIVTLSPLSCIPFHIASELCSRAVYVSPL